MMKSRGTQSFWKCYYELPKEIRRQAVKTYHMWREHPEAGGLQFKRVGKKEAVYSIRVNDSYRVLGLLEDNTIYWFWIGKHDEYERILKGL
jgi:plasmid maintenance system killer protein